MVVLLLPVGQHVGLGQQLGSILTAAVRQHLRLHLGLGWLAASYKYVSPTQLVGIALYYV
jgi:hypothetical protein